MFETETIFMEPKTVESFIIKGWNASAEQIVTFFALVIEALSPGVGKIFRDTILA